MGQGQSAERRLLRDVRRGLGRQRVEHLLRVRVGVRARVRVGVRVGVAVSGAGAGVGIRVSGWSTCARKVSMVQYGDVGRCREMWGDVGRCGEMWGDLERLLAQGVDGAVRPLREEDELVPRRPADAARAAVP